MEAHYNLGVVLLELGIYGEAVTAFYNTLILRPTMFEAWLNLGAYRAREQLLPAEPELTFSPSFFARSGA